MIMIPPVAGQKWSLPDIASKASAFATLIGTSGPNSDVPATAAFSAHVYRLSDSQVDGQSPHSEEELYYVISGSRELLIDEGLDTESRTDLAPGDLAYVPANVTHRFVGKNEIILFVIFAPNFSG